MDIDMTALRGSGAREGDLRSTSSSRRSRRRCSTAYQHTEGAQPHARVELDRKSGHVTVLRGGAGRGRQIVREYDDTPEDFGRIAAMTAKQVILQRLREARGRRHLRRVRRQGGRPRHRRGPGQGIDPTGIVIVDLGKVEALLPPPSRCRARRTSTASGSSARRRGAARGCAARR